MNNIIKDTYTKQNIIIRFIIDFFIFGTIFALTNVSNKMQQATEAAETLIDYDPIGLSDNSNKTLLDYFNEGSEFCALFKFEGNQSWYYCTVEYIENNANYKINKQFKSIQHNCEISTTYNADYTNCVHRVIEEVSK